MDSIGAKERRHQDDGAGSLVLTRGPGGATREVAAWLAERLPKREGRPIRVSFRPRLRASRGKLLSGGARGQEVHAGSNMRRRKVVVDSGLLADRAELLRILLHELFHFVWVRAGNPLRLSYEALLRTELGKEARGELGWSAEQRKTGLTSGDLASRSRRWREYVCESFCDSAACLLGACDTHPEFTLALRFRRPRAEWFRRLLALGKIAV